ncbi:MAG: hypothetical protein ACLGIR_08435 [Actinomycetes bacterium]
MSECFPVVDTSTWVVVDDEKMGRKAKDWLMDPSGAWWLFKHVRSNEGTNPRGEDWAEVIAAEVARRMGLPCAEVRLARRETPGENPRGIVSRNVLDREAPEKFEHGNELLAGAIEGYDRRASGAVTGYTVEAAMGVLAGVEVHPDLVGTELRSAADQLAAYLVFDGLVNGTDRHHQNWAVTKRPGGGRFLAESFDHGSCLGMTETQARKEAILTGDADALRRWLSNGRTKFEQGPRPLDVAETAMAAVNEAARRDILERVDAVTTEWVEETVDRVPSELMSHWDRRFAVAVVGHARKELLDEY